ncbi:MAG: glycosyltransferase family 4 protein [Oligoflexia bacterium]|nr:glycosyltransferase family 4 protein [Oligoflexia bacterium]
MQKYPSRTDISDFVQIDNPAEPMDGTPATLRLSADNTVDVSGRLRLAEGEILEVRCQVNRGPFVNGRCDRSTKRWEVCGVGPAREDVVNQICLVFRFLDANKQPLTKEFCRPFFGVGHLENRKSRHGGHFWDNSVAMVSQSLARPIRVAFATPMFRVGGVERWAAYLARWLDPERARLAAVIVTNEGALDQVAVSWLPRWVEIVESPSIPKDDSFDVIITEGLHNLVELLAGINKPSIDVQHGVCMSDSWRVRLVEAAVAAHSAHGTRLAGVNSLVVDNFPPHLRDSVSIIENGSDPAVSVPLVDREVLKSSLGITATDKVALYVGRIAEEKNVQTIIDAITFLGEPWHAVIVGPQFAPLDLSCSRVHLVPPKPHIGNWLGIADVLCHPSDHEAHCFAINDAWFAKVPVVTCDYPVNQRFRQLHGELGWVLPIRPSSADLAGAIQQAAVGRDDPRVRRAWETAHKCYSAALMGRRWTDFLCSVV